MKRREFITLLGGAAAAWPLAARAQQSRARETHRRAHEPCGRRSRGTGAPRRVSAGICRRRAGSVGRNAQIDIRWAAGDAVQMRKQVAEMVALAPDVILASSPQVVGPLRDATRTIPIVFVAVVDPVASGFVKAFPSRVAMSPVSLRSTTA